MADEGFSPRPKHQPLGAIDMSRFAAVDSNLSTRVHPEVQAALVELEEARHIVSTEGVSHETMSRLSEAVEAVRLAAGRYCTIGVER